jgi:hypothetical protein
MHSRPCFAGSGFIDRPTAIAAVVTSKRPVAARWFTLAAFKVEGNLLAERCVRRNLANKFAPTFAARWFRLAAFKVGGNLLARRCQENIPDL